MWAWLGARKNLWISKKMCVVRKKNAKSLYVLPTKNLAFFWKITYVLKTRKMQKMKLILTKNR